MRMHTKIAKECTFVIRSDYTGDVHIVVNPSQVETDKFHDLVTISLPFEAVKSLVYDYLRYRYKTMTDKELENSIGEFPPE